jgi:hypothetical protein
MTAENSLTSPDDLGVDSRPVRRPWRAMTLEYVGDVGTVMKSTHKSGSMGESDMFSNHRT